MMIPKKFKVGKKTYTVHVRPAKRRSRLRGRVWHGTGAIEIVAPPKHQAETFWHEMTHAVLHGMKHPLNRNEAFVTKFSRLLNKAIQSAKF